MNCFSTTDKIFINKKIDSSNNKSLVSIIGSSIGIVAIFLIPLSFLPRSYRVIGMDKSQTFFEYSPILSIIIILGFILFEIYFILIYLKLNKLKRDLKNGVKTVEKAIIVDFYKFKDLEEDNMQIILDINGKKEKNNLSLDEFSEFDFKKNQEIIVEILPISRYILSFKK